MKPHGNSKLTTKGDHLPPEVAEMADNLAPARTVPTKRGGGQPDFRQCRMWRSPLVSFVKCRPSVDIGSHLGRQVVIYQLVEPFAFALFVFDERKMRRGRPGEAQLS